MTDSPALIAFQALSHAFLPVLIVGLPVQIIRIFTVRGTHRRAVLTTVFHVVCLVGIANGLVMGAISAAHHEWLQTVLYVAVVAVWMWTYNQNFPDDDDWFNGRGRKIRRWLRRRLTSTRLTPAPTH